MTRASPFQSETLFHVGPVPVSVPVVTTWGIMLALLCASLLLTRHLKQRPGRIQTTVELLVTGIDGQIAMILGKGERRFLPLLGTLFVFLVCANLAGLLPGVKAPTATLETPAAVAAIVFFSVHYYGMRAQGLRGYLASFAKPSILMLPLNLITPVTRSFALMVRLFGNVMSGEFLIALVVGLTGLFVAVPFMALEMLIGVIQAYIFTVLATVFVGAALARQQEGETNGC